MVSLLDLAKSSLPKSFVKFVIAYNFGSVFDFMLDRHNNLSVSARLLDIIKVVNIILINGL